MPISGQHWTVEQRAAVEAELLASGLTPTEFARLRGHRLGTVQKLARELKARTTVPLHRPAVSASFVPSANMDNGELIAHLAKRSRAHREHFAAEKNRRLKIDTAEPFAITWFTDVHLGDNGADYDTLLEHCRLTAETPHAFGVFMGDASNNWPVNGKLGKQWAEQETSKHQERQLVEWFLKESGVPWLFWALGNHDLWGDGETILRQMNADLVPMAAWGAKVTLEMANGRECRLDLAHDHKGHSMWNALHAETKTAQMGWPADFVFSGHRHTAALHFEEFASRQISTWLMRAKGYKSADSYAFTNGFPEQTEGHAGVTVIDPGTSRKNPIVHASLSVEEGLDYLTFLRSRR
jgi:hypothetical protein